MSDSTPPSRFWPVLLAVLITAAVAGPFGAFWATRAASTASAQAAPELFQCPMHPAVTADHASNCPICGMKLVKVSQPEPGPPAPATAPAPASATGGDVYQCPMDLQIVQDHPGKCPICNMRLLKVAPPDAGAVAASERYYCPMHADVVEDHPGKCPLCGMTLLKVDTTVRVPLDMATIDIDAARQQLIGLRTAKVDRGLIDASLRTIGRVGIDETQVRSISVKVPGYVEKVFLDFVGKPVKKGQPLFSLYSPEVLAAENELLVALRTGGEGLGSPLVTAARRKLELWDVPAFEIQRLVREGKPSRTVTFVSPISGVVTKKELVEGARLEAGAMPYQVVDLSTVWVLADIYETELRFVAPGMPAKLTLKAFPGHSWEGTVLFVDPLLDPKTRTARMRLSFPNPQGELKPELFGEVTLERPKREVLRLPTDALIRGGTGDVIFVALGEGRFEPRHVQTGELGKDFSEVLSGAAEGDQVVTRANFLVDSESRLRASLSGLSGARPDAGAMP